jgi:hypothetical protein
MDHEDPIPFSEEGDISEGSPYIDPDLAVWG